MEIIPRKDKLVVKRCELDNKVGSILLAPPDKTQKSNRAVVVSVGPDCDPDLKPGVTIVFDERANEEFEDYLLLNTKDVYGIMNS